jgi:hypothetical protein
MYIAWALLLLYPASPAELFRAGLLRTTFQLLLIVTPAVGWKVTTVNKWDISWVSATLSLHAAVVLRYFSTTLGNTQLPTDRVVLSSSCLLMIGSSSLTNVHLSAQRSLPLPFLSLSIFPLDYSKECNGIQQRWYGMSAIWDAAATTSAVHFTLRLFKEIFFVASAMSERPHQWCLRHCCISGISAN